MKLFDRARALRVGMLAGAAALSLAIPASAEAASTAESSGAGPGSTVTVNGDNAPNKFVAVPEGSGVRIADMTGGTINPGPNCSRYLYAGAYPVASNVVCTAAPRSVGIRSIAFNYGGGNDNAPKPGNAWPVSVNGGPGDDTIRSAAAGSVLLGGPGNDKLVGSAGHDVMIDTSGADRALGHGAPVSNPDYFYVQDGVANDTISCGNVKGSTIFADPGDLRSGCL